MECAQRAALAELELWRGAPQRAWTIIEAALARFEDAEFLFYSAPLYALGAWAQADGALRDRALRRDSEHPRAAVVALAERFDALLVDTAPPRVGGLSRAAGGGARPPRGIRPTPPAGAP